MQELITLVTLCQCTRLVLAENPGTTYDVVLKKTPRAIRPTANDEFPTKAVGCQKRVFTFKGDYTETGFRIFREQED